MADALCGPSNALQNFQKHAATDRTLQQDRLTVRKTASNHSFRSTTSNAGILDPEFEAFQRGHSPGPMIQENPHFNPRFQQNVPQNMMPAPGPVAGWAADFQNLRISTPPPQAQFQKPGQSSRTQPSAASWHQDFMNQQSAPTPVQQNFAQPMFGQPFGMSQGYPQHGLYQGPQQEMSNGKGKAVESVPAFDEAAFDRAFEIAHAEMLEKETAAFTQEETAAQEALNIAENREAAHDMRSNISLDQPALLQPDPTQEQQQNATDQPPHDDEELALTAGRLLDSVSDNQTQKFKQSNFLELMRRLRDHEVRVEGDKVVEVTAMGQSHHPQQSRPEPEPRYAGEDPGRYRERGYSPGPTRNGLSKGPRIDENPGEWYIPQLGEYEG